MESLYIHMKFFTTLIFCLSLPTFLLSQEISPLGGGGGGGGGRDQVIAPSVQQATAPPPGDIPTITPPSGGEPTSAPSLAPAVAPSGTIKRLTKQHILATIPPNAADSSRPFIASPSRKYVGYLLRSETAPGAGGFGNAFCYVQVRDASTGQSVWESNCAPASISDACSLVFTDAGLEVFDGSRSAWDAGVDAQHLETLELVDEGDMRIRTRDGELAWKASDQPLANQQCGAPGSPGMASVLPPFAAPVEDSRNLPFGQPSVQGGQQPQQQPGGTLFNQQPQQPLSGFAQPLGESGQQQPLVDNTPFDSGCATVYQCWFAMALALVLTLAAYGFLF